MTVSKCEKNWRNFHWNLILSYSKYILSHCEGSQKYLSTIMWQSYCSKKDWGFFSCVKSISEHRDSLSEVKHSPLKNQEKLTMHELGGGGSTIMVGLTIKIPFSLILPLWPEQFFSTLFVKVWLDPPRLLSSVNPSPQMTLIKIVSTHHLPYNLSSHTYIKLEE